MHERVQRLLRFGLTVAVLVLGASMCAADSPRVAPHDVKDYSPDRRFYVVSQLQQKHTAVFRAGKKEAEWELPGYHPILYLSNDGKHLVEGYEGGNLFNGTTKDSDPFLTFFAGPKCTAVLTVAQVFPHWKTLPRTASRLRWGDFWGFEKPAQFTVRLDDGTKLFFDADTGKQASR